MDIDRAWCGDCGIELEPVRPGKHQHPDPYCAGPDPSKMKFILMDHVSNREEEVTFDEFIGMIKTLASTWISPGHWVNVQFSTGDPKPTKSYSLIVKKE